MVSPASRRRRRSFLTPFLAGALLHAAAVAMAWRGWDPGWRGGALVWMDFPASLAYLGLSGRTLLATSLVAGGVQWGLLAAGLNWLVGRVAAERRA